LHFASFSPSFACPIQDGQEMAKELKVDQIILNKLLTDIEKAQPRNIYLKVRFGEKPVDFI
jgi:hypothetical protein